MGSICRCSYTRERICAAMPAPVLPTRYELAKPSKLFSTSNANHASRISWKAGRVLLFPSSSDFVNMPASHGLASAAALSASNNARVSSNVLRCGVTMRRSLLYFNGVNSLKVYI